MWLVASHTDKRHVQQGSDIYDSEDELQVKWQEVIVSESSIDLNDISSPEADSIRGRSLAAIGPSVVHWGTQTSCVGCWRL